MDNNGFSHLSRSGRFTNSATNLGESQSGQNVEQEQATFSGRSVSPHDPENPFLTETSLSQPKSKSSTPSGSAIINLPKDPFVTLATYQSTGFEECQLKLYCGFGILGEFPGTHPPVELEVTSQSSGRSTLASMMDSPALYSHGAESSFQGYASASASSVMVDSGIPLNLIQPDIIGPSYSRLQQPVKSPPQKRAKSDSKQAVSPPPRVTAKVKPSKRHVGSVDEWLLRTDSKEKPFMCGCPGCGRTFRSSRALRSHTFEHSGVSEHRCTYPECGPKAYFRDNKALRRHFSRVHNLVKPPTCPHCCRAFASQTMLNAHFKNDHLIYGDNIPPT